MTIDDFKILEEHQKVQLIFDANKITEKIDNESNYQLFQIDNFFVETKTSLEGKFKRSIKTYALKELPVDYVGEVLRMPIVKFESELQPTPNPAFSSKKKENFI
ncbi:MAG: hypothetical protein JWR18_4113 [Segetibacter sp.]|jgi:hypothetical protein|nr:hypothetical protein [Segetibacter sp.]